MKVLIRHALQDLHLDPLRGQPPARVRVFIAYGAIRGSDLRYRRRGGSGRVHMKEPMGIRYFPGCCGRRSPPSAPDPGGRQT